MSDAVRPALDDLAADALEWPAVRAGIAAHAASSLGRRALAELTPRAADDARRALARTDELLRLGPRSQPPLAGVTDPLPALEDARAFGRAMEPEELHVLEVFLRAASDLAHWLRARRTELPATALLAEGIAQLDELAARLGDAIDARGRVVDSASVALARLRRELAGLEREIDATMRRLAGRADWKVVLADGHGGRVQRRGGRPTLAVRARSAGRVPGIVHDRSQSGETLFVEPAEVVEAGNRLAACRQDEAREVARILAELTRVVLEHREDIERTAAALAELELAVMGAAWARAVGGRPARVPALGDEGAGREAGSSEPPARGLLLRSARHPLLLAEQAAGRLDEVVPIDLRLGVEFDLLVITGPNTGGKTLALKTAGLAALLTRLGLPLPCAEGTCVPLYDGIVADIGDEQEIAQNLSTFSSHLTRIRRALDAATPRTLVLIDELGSGTDPDEGAALGDAILATLLERGVPTIASTHLGRLKHFAFRHRRAENACTEFDLETLAPRYHLILGAPGESRALAIAARLGLPAELLARAEQELERGDEEQRELMARLVGSRVEAERLRAEAEERREDVEREARAIADERGALERRGRMLEAEAQRDLERRAAEALRLVGRARSLLDQLGTAQRAALAEVVAGLEQALGGAVLSEQRREFLAGLKKGVLVWVPRFSKRCAVTRVDRKRERVKVLVGRREMEVGFEDVTMFDAL